MRKIKLAYCGDDCSKCPRYVATISGDIEKLKESAMLMAKAGWERDTDDLEGLKCSDCQDVESCEYGVKECCLEKQIDNCGQCVSYPCSLINEAFEITRGYADNFINILSKKEYEIFHEAFFLKKENLDNEYQKRKK